MLKDDLFKNNSDCWQCIIVRTQGRLSPRCRCSGNGGGTPGAAAAAGRGRGGRWVTLCSLLSPSGRCGRSGQTIKYTLVGQRGGDSVDLTRPHGEDE